MNTFPAIYYAAPGAPVGGGAAPPSSAQTGGQPQSPTPQPPAPGQGPADQGLSPQFRQQYFPNVPDEHWSVMEPHIQGINKHVTQLEQRYAPFRGYTPEAVQGLAEFSAALEQDPVGQWIRLARVLQEQGAIDPSLDLDHLAMGAAGQWDDDESEPQPGPQQQQNGEIPPWAQQFLERQERLEQQVVQDRQSTRQRTEDAVLQRQLTTMKKSLTEAGYPDDALTQENLLASYIAHRGNVNKAVETAVNQRNAILQGYTGEPDTRKKQQQDKDLDLPNGTPGTRKPSTKGQGRGMFRDVSAAAEQALAKAQRGE